MGATDNLRARVRRLQRRRATVAEWDRARPVYEMDGEFRRTMLAQLSRGQEGLQITGERTCRALALDRNFNPVGIRSLRDIRTHALNRRTIRTYTRTARGWLDGRNRMNARLILIWLDDGNALTSAVAILPKRLTGGWQ